MWDKIFTKPTYLCIAVSLEGYNSRQCGKGHHNCYAIFNMGEKFIDKIYAIENRW